MLDLLEHLRHLMLVQHTGEVPDTLPVTDETRERLREQANQLGAPTVIRLIDLLHVAVDDMRQGGDPRLPLELGLVKVTRPGADLSREALAFRVDRLEHGHVPPSPAAEPSPVGRGAAPSRRAGRSRHPPPTSRSRAAVARARAAAGGVAADGAAGGRGALDARRRRCSRKRIRPRSQATRSRSSSHRRRSSTSARPRSRRTRRCSLDALYEVTGRRLSVVFALGEEREAAAEEAEHPATEEEIVELMKRTFDAHELT